MYLLMCYNFNLLTKKLDIPKSTAAPIPVQEKRLVPATKLYENQDSLFILANIGPNVCAVCRKRIVNQELRVKTTSAAKTTVCLNVRCITAHSKLTKVKN